MFLDQILDDLPLCVGGRRRRGAEGCSEGLFRRGCYFAAFGSVSTTRGEDGANRIVAGIAVDERTDRRGAPWSDSFNPICAPDRAAGAVAAGPNRSPGESADTVPTGEGRAPKICRGPREIAETRRCRRRGPPTTLLTWHPEVHVCPTMSLDRSIRSFKPTAPSREVLRAGAGHGRGSRSNFEIEPTLMPTSPAEGSSAMCR